MAIYFIRSDDSGPVKIGFAVDVLRRLSQLQIGSAAALSLIGVIPGEPRDERLIHSRFKHLRVRGEWFAPEILEEFPDLVPPKASRRVQARTGLDSPLGRWLAENGIKRTAFAKAIGVTSGYVTQLCDGTAWPSRNVVSRIAAETDGAISAIDFIAPKAAA